MKSESPQEILDNLCLNLPWKPKLHGKNRRKLKKKILEYFGWSPMKHPKLKNYFLNTLVIYYYERHISWIHNFQ